MAELDPTAQIQFLLSDFNTRLKDAEERNMAIRERVLLLGKNLISSKEDTDKEIETLKKQTSQMQRDFEKLKTISNNILEETSRFVRRDEIFLVERMLKDFQPLQFARIKDVEEIIERKIGQVKRKPRKKKRIKKQLKTTKSKR